jgi:hypothetical protein
MPQDNEVNCLGLCRLTAAHAVYLPGTVLPYKVYLDRKYMLPEESPFIKRVLIAEVSDRLANMFGQTSPSYDAPRLYFAFTSSRSVASELGLARSRGLLVLPDIFS